MLLLVVAHHNAKANEYGEVPENESKFFAKVALPEIVPVLLDLLTHQDEDDDEDEDGEGDGEGTAKKAWVMAVIEDAKGKEWQFQRT